MGCCGDACGPRRGLCGDPCRGLCGLRRGPPGPACSPRVTLHSGSASAQCAPVRCQPPPSLPGFLARFGLYRPAPERAWLTEGLAPRLSRVLDAKVSSPTFSFFTLRRTWFCPQDFHFLDKCIFFFFSSLVLCLGVVGQPFCVSPPFLCVGVSHTPTPPYRDPCQGPLVSAGLTSTSCLRAKPSPRQPQPDWQRPEAWRGGPGVGSSASHWPALQPRLCGEPDKESRAEARCRRWEPRGGRGRSRGADMSTLGWWRRRAPGALWAC